MNKKQLEKDIIELGEISSLISKAIDKNISLVKIVKESGVILRKTGKNYVGLCPFHKEESPSFVISPEKQIYHCFGCGTGGDVINYIMEKQGRNFKKSITYIAEKCGYNLDPMFAKVLIAYLEYKREKVTQEAKLN